MAARRVASAYSARRLTTPSDRLAACSLPPPRPFVGVALQGTYHYSNSERDSSLESHTPYLHLSRHKDPNMTTGISTARALAAELDQRCPGCVLSGPDYDRTRRIWNGAVDHVPALIVRPHAPNDVQTAILIAQHHGVPLSVRGGGHDWAGRSLRRDGMVIDLSAMNRVAVDPQTQRGRRHHRRCDQGGQSAPAIRRHRHRRRCRDGRVDPRRRLRPTDRPL